MPLVRQMLRSDCYRVQPVIPFMPRGAADIISGKMAVLWRYSATIAANLFGAVIL